MKFDLNIKEDRRTLPLDELLRDFDPSGYPERVRDVLEPFRTLAETLASDLRVVSVIGKPNNPEMTWKREALILLLGSFDATANAALAMGPPR